MGSLCTDSEFGFVGTHPNARAVDVLSYAGTDSEMGFLGLHSDFESDATERKFQEGVQKLLQQEVPLLLHLQLEQHAIQLKQ